MFKGLSMKHIIPIAFAVLVGFALVTVIRGRAAQAPTPEVFAQNVSLERAIARSKETGKPVYAVVTATWCGPCQQLKKNTLADPEVASWIEKNTIPVFIDSDRSRDDAAWLGVSGIPASFVLRGGEIVASSVGYAKPAEYLEFLKNAVPGG